MARILIADTDTGSAEILRAELEGDGHEIAQADSGLDAYQYVLRDAPEMVILGPNLPVHDGFETTEMLRADPDVPDHLPIVMLGSKDLDTLRVERVGVTATLPRAHSASDVRELISKLLARR